MTLDPYFPVLVFFGLLLTTGEVELIFVSIDQEYWDIVGDDPV